MGNTGEKQKKYFKRQNLAQPIVERFSSLEPVSFEGFDVVYSKKYDQLVSNLDRVRNVGVSAAN